MPRWLAPFLAVLAILILAGGLAPLAWWAVQALAGVAPPEVAAALTRHPFHRYVSRCLLVVALALLVPLARYLGARSRRDLGVAWDAGSARQLALGAGLGFVMFGALLGVELLGGWRRWRTETLTAEVVGLAILRAGMGGVLVALAEELLFRGLLVLGWQRCVGWSRALPLAAVFYAAGHFLQRVHSPPVIDWFAGWRVLGEMLGGLVSPDRLVPAFGTLFLAGLLLGCTVQWTGAIWLAVGMHASWVMWLKLGAMFTARVVPDGTVSSPRLEGILVPGWPPFALMSLTLILAVFLKTHRPAAVRSFLKSARE